MFQNRVTVQKIILKSEVGAGAFFALSRSLFFVILRHKIIRPPEALRSAPTVAQTQKTAVAKAPVKLSEEWLSPTVRYHCGGWSEEV